MKFGILGYRHGHIEEFIQEMLSQGHELVGICEKESDSVEAIAKRHGVPFFKDEKDLFNLEPQIIGTSAVNNEKIDIIESCSKRGIHVMTDKPIVTNLKDFERLKKVVEKGSIQIGMMLTERFNPPMYTLKTMIDDGLLGDIISFNFMKPHKLFESTRDPWHFSKHKNGGIIIDLLIHDFDLLRWFTNSNVAESMGYCSKNRADKYPGFLDNVHAVVKMENGVVASLMTDWWTPDSKSFFSWGDSRIFCTGTLGKVEIRAAGDIFKKEPYILMYVKDEECIIYENRKPQVNLAQDFINRIEGSSDVVITHNDILSATYNTLILDKNVRIAKS